MGLDLVPKKMFGAGQKKYLFLNLLHNQLYIREELVSDYTEISELIHKAFLQFNAKPSEPKLVNKLRLNNAHVSKLCSVAVTGSKIVGHIFYTNLKLNNHVNSLKLLSLAPVSVLPEFQGKGIGSILINKTITEAKALGYDAIVLVGHAEYYPRFGFKKLSNTKIELPFEVPDDNAMILELSPDSCKGITGLIQFDQAFSV